MRKALIDGANANPGAPEGMTDDQVGRLPVRVHRFEDGTLACLSAWRPTDEEIMTLALGGYVVLTVLGWQVPVSLTVVGKEGASEL